MLPIELELTDTEKINILSNIERLLRSDTNLVDVRLTKTPGKVVLAAKKEGLEKFIDADSITIYFRVETRFVILAQAPYSRVPVEDSRETSCFVKAITEAGNIKSEYVQKKNWFLVTQKIDLHEDSFSTKTSLVMGLERVYKTFIQYFKHHKRYARDLGIDFP